MKRSGIKRGDSELKRTGLTKKPAKKHTPKWYKQKVYEAFMAPYRGLPCEICGATHDATGRRSCAHHVISQGSCPHHKVTAKMVIVLCPKCHAWAHGGGLGNGKAVDPFNVRDFLTWLALNRTAQHEWCLAHRHDTATTCGKIPWQELYEAL